MYCHYFYTKHCKNESKCNFIHLDYNNFPVGVCPNNLCKLCQGSQETKISHQKPYFFNLRIKKEEQQVDENQQQKSSQQQVIKSRIIGNLPVDESKIKQAKLIEFDLEKYQQQLNEALLRVEIDEIQLRIVEIHNDLKLIEPFQQQLHLLRYVDLDIMFIMDCTGSMSSWIEQTKLELANIIDCVRKVNQQCSKIRISFIGYRDFCDQGNQFIIKDFTDNLDEVLQLIKQIKAEGGGDAPENIAGAFELALNQDWKAQAKFCILVADAPCHGSKYHNYLDDYPKGDPLCRQPEEQVQQLAKLGIQLYAIKITQITEKMFQILSESYLVASSSQMKLVIEDLGHCVQNFRFFVANSISATVHSSASKLSANIFEQIYQFIQNEKNQLTDKKDKERKYGVLYQSLLKLKLIKQQDQQESNSLSESQINENHQHLEMRLKELIIRDKTEQQQQQPQQQAEKEEALIQFSLMFDAPNWFQLQNSKQYECLAHSFAIRKETDSDINWKKPLIQHSFIKTKITICNQPFSQGSMKFSFYAFENELFQKMVAKLPKLQYKDQNRQFLEMQHDIESFIICRHIVNMYNDKLINLQVEGKLLQHFVSIFIYQILDNDAQYRYYYAENHIQGNYEKFNNNMGWFSEFATQQTMISQALSHYSWQITQGYLMIVDLQGNVLGTLTDPQIHCMDRKRFGKGNLGYQGIITFFSTHVCNDYCKNLRLLHPKTGVTLPENFKTFFVNMAEYPSNPDELVNNLCDVCRIPHQLKALDLFLNQWQYGENFCRCPECAIKCNNSMNIKQCFECKEFFKYSQYWHQMKRTNQPRYCRDCRKLRREQFRKELEEKE